VQFNEKIIEHDHDATMMLIIAHRSTQIYMVAQSSNILLCTVSVKICGIRALIIAHRFTWQRKDGTPYYAKILTSLIVSANYSYNIIGKHFCIEINQNTQAHFR